MHINVSTPQHLDILGIITALVCIWQPNPVWKVTSLHLWCLTKKKKKGNYITDMREPIWYLSCSIKEKNRQTIVKVFVF